MSRCATCDGPAEHPFIYCSQACRVAAENAQAIPHSSEPSPDTVKRVTASMQQAYVEWEPPFSLTSLPSNPAPVMFAIRESFFGGYLAAALSGPVLSQVESETTAGQRALEERLYTALLAVEYPDESAPILVDTSKHLRSYAQKLANALSQSPDRSRRVEGALEPASGLAPCCQLGGSCERLLFHINNLIENAYRVGRNDLREGVEYDPSGLLLDAAHLAALSSHSGGEA